MVPSAHGREGADALDEGGDAVAVAGFGGEGGEVVGGGGAGLGGEVNVVGQGLEGGGAAGDFAGLQDGDGAAEVEKKAQESWQVETGILPTI